MALFFKVLYSNKISFGLLSEALRLFIFMEENIDPLKTNSSNQENPLTNESVDNNIKRDKSDINLYQSLVDILTNLLNKDNLYPNKVRADLQIQKLILILQDVLHHQKDNYFL